MSETLKIQQPIGYVVEWRPGDQCFYRVEDMAAEAKALEVAEVRALFQVEQEPGQQPTAWRGLYWCSAKHREANAYMDPDAMPCYAGPVLREHHINPEVARIFPSLSRPPHAL